MARLNPPRPLEVVHKPETFDCGRESMNLWLRRHAWRNQLHNISRTTVFTDRNTGMMVGYVAPAAGQIEREFLPKKLRRDRPAALPVMLLGQLAVDRRFQGQGMARQLLYLRLDDLRGAVEGSGLLWRHHPSARRCPARVLREICLYRSARRSAPRDDRANRRPGEKWFRVLSRTGGNCNALRRRH